MHFVLESTSDYVTVVHITFVLNSKLMIITNNSCICVNATVCLVYYIAPLFSRTPQYITKLPAGIVIVLQCCKNNVFH